jgi:hypothetical protein
MLTAVRTSNLTNKFRVQEIFGQNLLSIRFGLISVICKQLRIMTEADLISKSLVNYSPGGGSSSSIYV